MARRIEYTRLQDEYVLAFHQNTSDPQDDVVMVELHRKGPERLARLGPKAWVNWKGSSRREGMNLFHWTHVGAAQEYAETLAEAAHCAKHLEIIAREHGFDRVVTFVEYVRRQDGMEDLKAALVTVSFLLSKDWQPEEKKR